MIDGKRLKELREEKNITVEELGISAGVSRQQIARYEANQTDVTSDVLLKIAQFLDVSTDYLLGNSDSKQQSGNRPVGKTKIELDRLIKLSPATAARFLNMLSIKFEPDPVTIDIEQLLQNLPPNYVAQFLKELDINWIVKMPSDTKGDNSP